MRDDTVGVPIRCMLRASLGRDKAFWGPGIAVLLHGIENCESLRASAQNMGMSYSKAWKIIHRAEQELGVQLVESTVGGTSGGGSQLTDQAIQILESYDAMMIEVQQLQEELFKKYFKPLLTVKSIGMKSSR